MLNKSQVLAALARQPSVRRSECSQTAIDALKRLTGLVRVGLRRITLTEDARALRIAGFASGFRTP